MAIAKTTLAVVLLVLVLSTETDLVKIHRASPRTSKSKPSVEDNANGWFSFCRYVPDISKFFVKKEAWIFSIPSTILVGLCGVFPVLLIPVESGHALREGVTADHLRLLLSFAVGGLLGDVFLHLLPESWSKGDIGDPHTVNFYVGAWVIAGIFSFFILEKSFGEDEEDEDNVEEDKSKEIKDEQINSKDCKLIQNGMSHDAKHVQNGNCLKEINGLVYTGDDSDIRRRLVLRSTQSESTHQDENSEVKKGKTKEFKIKVVGYLNLFANFIDNFTHGLAVAGSYVVSRKVGMCTTCAILLHEIPHEIGDFAILLRSGFDKKNAALAQIMTASGGLFGCFVGLIADHAGDATAWILPLSSGGFIYIAMVTIIPELLEEKRPRESIKQVLMMIAGILSMALVSIIH